MSGYVGIDSAVRIVIQESLMAAVLDPAGSIALALNLVLFVGAILYIAALAGLIQFTGRGG